MQQRIKMTIGRQCPFCGDIITVFAGQTIPEDIEYIKTRQHTVILVHKRCIPKGGKQNEHI